jgi:choline dehydrogenase-like flavoprotein
MCTFFLNTFLIIHKMHVDARKLENGSVLEGDICIVGAGAAGISMAMEWINTPYKVILLEGGGFEYDDQMQELFAGKTTGQRYFPLRSVRLHYFGGTTGHWAGYCSPLDPVDFKKRDWVANSGWPINRGDLDPYYARTQKILELGPYEYNSEYWQKQDPAFVPLPIGEDRVWNKIWQFSPPTRFGTRYRETIVKAKNIHLYTYANVVEITSNDSVSSVQELRTTNFAGKSHRARAKFFILACCAIQNARLLLASRRQAPNGLGNDQDLVGRYFMEHVEIKSGELWFAEPQQLKMYMIDFGKTKVRAELGITEALQEKHKILNGTASLNPLELAKNRPEFIDTWNKNEKEAEKQMRFMDKKLMRAISVPQTAKAYKGFQLFTRIEQAPNPNCRVTLDTEKDAFGVPLSILHWELGSLEKRSIRTIDELIGQDCGRAGIARVRLLDYLQDENEQSWPSFTGGGWHHMGTTRMSDDPKTGVVDKDCKVHNLHNLYVAGSSCNVTAGAPNPTLTLIALTLRLSDHIKNSIAGHPR